MGEDASEVKWKCDQRPGVVPSQRASSLGQLSGRSEDDGQGVNEVADHDEAV